MIKWKTCHRRAYSNYRDTIFLTLHFFRYRVHDKFIEARCVNKSKKLYDWLHLVKILVDQRQEEQGKKVDLRKETMKFYRKVDVARSRRHDIYKLLSREIENFLTKECYLRKLDKHELVNKIEKGPLKSTYPKRQQKASDKKRVVPKN